MDDLTTRTALEDEVRTLRRALASRRERDIPESLGFLVDAIPALVAFVDAGGFYRLANRAYEEWLGCPRGSLPGRRVVDVLDPVAYARLRPHIDAALAGATVEFDAELPTPRGESRHVHATHVPHHGSEGPVVGFIAHILDITERKLAERALRARGQQLAAVLRGVGDAITMQDADGRLVYANAAAAALLGAPDLQALLAAPPDRVLAAFEPLDDAGAPLPHAQLPSRRALRGEPVDGELVRFRRRGDPRDRWASVAATPLLDERGRVEFVVSIFKDVTDRHAAAAALEASERRFRAVFDEALDAMLLADDDARLVDVNAAACALVGRSKPELLALGVFDLADGADRERLRADWQALRAAGSRRGQWLLRGPEHPREVEYTAAADIVPGRHLAILRDIGPRLRAERALADQHKLTRAITDNATAALFLLDERQRCTFMNPAAAAMTGFTLAEVQGRPLHDLIHHSRPDGRPYPIHDCPIARALPDARQHRGEDMLVGRDGRFYPIAYVATPLLGDGQPVGTLIEVQDLSAERDTRDALTLQAQVLQSMAEGVCVTDDAGRILFTNAAEDAIFGYAPGELLGRDVDELGPWPPEAAAALRAGGRWSGEFTARRKTGAPFVARAHVTVLDLSGRRHRVCVQQDVTQETRDRASLDLLARASTLLGASLDVRATLQDLAQLAVPHLGAWCSIYLGDDAGALELVAVAHVDPDRAALLREQSRRWPPAPDRPDGLYAALQTRRPLRLAAVDPAAHAHDPEHRAALAALGATGWMIAPMIAHDRLLGGIAVGLADPTRRHDDADEHLLAEVARRAAVALDNARLYEVAQRERTRAEEANRAKDLFLSTLSHELRTPLTSILGWTRMLRTQHLSDDKREKGLETIDRNARAQVAIIEDILDLSRIVTGKLRLELRPIELSPVVEAALDTVRPSADARGVRVRADLDPDVGAVLGDPDRLQQIVWNILTNAVKFTPRGGQVALELRRDGGEAELRVVDTGQGIPAEFLPHVFDRFRQADASTTRTHGGLGLGLAIVKHLVELHGGRVAADSPGEGRGATFTVRLPSASHPAVVDRPVEGAPTGVLAGRRVLVVDDEHDTRELIVSVLEHDGAAITTATSADQAIERVRSVRPDVVVSDIAMPGEDGYSLIRRLRALPREHGGRTPALALTAHARAEDRTRALAAGFDMHVSKPIDPAELLRTLADLIARTPA
jgi:PAS domain S-box-containing protein